MSEATLDALNTAIRNHVADEGEGDYVSGWVVATAAAIADDPEATAYRYITPNQPVHITLGLLDKAQRWFRRYDEQEGDDE